jgi:hypothetical protein
MWGGWATSITLALLRVGDTVDAQWGSVITIVVAISVAASVVRSRYRLQEAVIGALRVGMTYRDEKDKESDDDGEQ